MKTFTSRDDAVEFLLREDKPCNFAKVTLHILEADAVIMTFSDVEILAAYSVVETMLKIVDDKICVDGVPLFNLYGYPL